MPSTATRQSRQEIMAEARAPYHRAISKLVAALQECVTSQDSLNNMRGQDAALQATLRLVDINIVATEALREINGWPRKTT